MLWAKFGLSPEGGSPKAEERFRIGGESSVSRRKMFLTNYDSFDGRALFCLASDEWVVCFQEITTGTNIS